MKKYKFIGVPIKYGCTIEGADKGIDKLKEYINFDYIIDIPTYEEEFNKNMIDIEKVTEINNNLANIVDKVIKEGYIPVTIGGDHSLAIGSIAGSSNNNDLNLLWIDAHTDINTHLTTISGRIHGFPVACSIGLGPDKLANLNHKGAKIKKENVTLFGTSDIDDLEYNIVKENKIENILLSEIEEKGLDYYLDYLEKKLKGKKIHLSFDLDCINPTHFKFINVPNRDNIGFDFNQIDKIIKLVKKLNIVSIDVVEYNPTNDINNDGMKYVIDLINKLTR